MDSVDMERLRKSITGLGPGDVRVNVHATEESPWPPRRVLLLLHPGSLHLASDKEQHVMRAWKELHPDARELSYEVIPARYNQGVLLTRIIFLLGVVCTALGTARDSVALATSTLRVGERCLYYNGSDVSKLLHTVLLGGYTVGVILTLVILYRHSLLGVYRHYLLFSVVRNRTIVLFGALGSIKFFYDDIGEGMTRFASEVIVNALVVSFSDIIITSPYCRSRLTRWFAQACFLSWASFVMAAYMRGAALCPSKLHELRDFAIITASSTFWLAGVVKVLSLLSRKIVSVERPFIFFTPDESYTSLLSPDPACHKHILQRRGVQLIALEPQPGENKEDESGGHVRDGDGPASPDAKGVS